MPQQNKEQRNKEILKDILSGTSFVAAGRKHQISGDVAKAAVMKYARKMEFAFQLRTKRSFWNKNDIEENKKLLLEHIDRKFPDIFSYVPERIVRYLRKIFGDNFEEKWREIEAYDKRKLLDCLTFGQTSLAGLERWIEKKKKIDEKF